MGTLVYALIVGCVVFWAAFRVIRPREPSYASKDFIRTEMIEETERKIITRSSIHQMVYPIYQFIQSKNPLSKSRYEQIEEKLKRAGDYEATVEDIQIAQIANVLIYPLFFLLISFLIGGELRNYLIGFGMFAGFYMYSQPLRVLKGKEKVHNVNILSDFTRFVTVYLMQSSGNKPTYDALLSSIEKTKDKTLALGYYLKQLENDLYTRPPEDALRRFSLQLDRPYVDRFVNNILLMLSQADDNNVELNMRLRDSLTELQNELTEQKIAEMKVQARVPTYVGVLSIAVYMIVLLGVTLIFMF